MEKKSEDKASSSEAAANSEVNDNVLQSDSNLKSGNDSDASEKKVSQPIEDDEDDIDEDLLLCTSSDMEGFVDQHGVKEIDNIPADGEKYFSDIESSDNSQEYEEQKSVEKDAVVIERDVIELTKEGKGTDEVERSEEKHKESGKTTELELEPVESDEEEFDENLPVKKAEESNVKKDEEKEPTLVKGSKEIEEISDKEDALSQQESTDVATSTEEHKGDTQNNDQSLNKESPDIPEENDNPSKCALADNKCEKTSDEEPLGKEEKTVTVESDPKETPNTLVIKEKTDEPSKELETKKEDAVPVDDIETDKGQQDGANEAVELKESADVSTSPILKETIAEIDKGIENTNEDGSKPDVKELGTAKTSEKPRESIDGDSGEEVKDKEPEKSDESAFPSTKEVSKDPPASGSETLSTTSAPREGIDSTSGEEMKPLDGNITPENIQEDIASPQKQAIPKETETISKKEGLPEETKTISEKKAVPKETGAILEKEAVPKETGAILQKEAVQKEMEAISEKEDVCGPKDTDNQTEGVPNSDKSVLAESAKTKDKTDEAAEEEDVLMVVEIESEAEDKQGENDAENKEKLVKEIAHGSVQSLDENTGDSDKVETEAQKTEQTKDVPLAANITTQPKDGPKAIDDKDKAPSKPDDAPDEIFSNENSFLKDKLTTKVSELMKTIDTCSLQGPTSDDDESLLVIDTTHKDDQENDDNDMDTETEQTVATGSATDSSSDGSLEIFYDKECSNYDCQHGSKNFYRAPQFALSYYKVSKKRYKPQFVCEDCYDQALHEYEEMCVILKQRQPLYGSNIKRQDFVEIIDSSDDEDTESNADNCKDENTFPKESIEFLENELEGIIRNVMQSVDIQNQLSWTKQVLQQSLDRVKEESSYVSEQLQQLQKKADKMHNSLYQCPSIKIRQLTPLDLNSGRSYSPESESTIPAIGDIERPSIQLNETYYAVKNKAIASWVPCKVVEEVEDSTSQAKNLKHFKIKFLKSKYPMLKTLSTKHMAYFDPPRVRLPIGTRVIAYFDASSLSRGKEKMLIPSAFYPGIIAEPLKTSNKYRYLVFYDDGYFQYVSYKDVRLVCHASENVWDDVHHQSREFIQNYLTQYAVNRPMVQTQKGQCMLVDYNGKWVYARVVDVDCSLVQMMFEGHSRSEWIYRGSTRLGPVYKESNNIAPKTSWNQSRLSRRTEPFIRYFNDEDSSSSQLNPQSQQQQAKSGEVRSVAKKSVSRTEATTGAQPVPVVKHLNNSTIFVDDDNKPKGKVVYYTARKNLPPRDFVPHICSPSCPFVITHNLQFYSPLAKPLLSGWERQVFRQKSKRFIVYRGPCGKRLRNMDELHRYLRVTNNELNVDNFDFSSETNCLAEYVIESCIVQKKDISNGEEKMPIPCVNYYDNTMPPDCKYSSRRIPTEGVHLNVDSDFLVGCDCEDDCSDKSKCSCWQLTYAGAKYSMPNVPHEMVGYQYKRLYAHVPTGIYECNSRCKCKANCVNRVVQQSLQSKLQVFKTSNRGWGLRCINDVPRGSFICIYAGHLLTEQKANEGGLDAGDEYFAELDYIEVAEQIKEGYESDVVEPEEEEDMYNPDKDDDDDEFVAPGDPNRNKSINTRLSTRRTTKNSSDAEHDSQERQVISFEPKKSQERPNSATERPTMRRLFGRDEGTYIMDAKITGNLGRYFNHSCSPNLFVQNVFVDTHDLRFPWVAFFAFSHIRAGTELTWNYNYEVGVVPGKVLYCQCGAPNCRQRLL